MNLKSMIPVGRERSGLTGEYQPFLTLQREMGRLFDEFSRGFPTFGSTDLTPRMNITETDKEIELTAELPGLEEKDVNINVADNILTIRGEKQVEKEEKDKEYRLFERSYGSFSRSIDLPIGVDPDKIKATIANGVLKVSVPKPAAAVVKKIDVKAAA